MLIKDLAIALSLSNLCFISAWRLLLIPSAFVIYHRKTPPPPVEYVALILDVMLLAALFFIVIVLIRRSRNRFVKKAAKIGFILLLSLPMYGLLAQIDSVEVRQLIVPHVGDEVVLRRLLFSIPLTICLFILLIALLRIDRAARIAVTLILIMVPLVLVSILQAVVTAVKHHGFELETAAGPLAGKLERERPRVLWLIFDELDLRTAFVERPSTVQLPELDRLADQGLFAENAYPPAGETFLTMPALLTGRLVSDARRGGSDELMIKYSDDSEPTPWSAQPNIFSRARDAGFNTALVGWYHPYCRILSGSLTKCAWEDGLLLPAAGLTPYMYAHIRQVALTSVFATLISRRLHDVADPVRRKQVSNFEISYRQAVDAASDRDLGVVVVHWPIPHPPNIYNRTTKRISVASGQSYLDNLALVDRTLGDVRRAMESNGTWDTTAVLISSDHWWRAAPLWKKYGVWTEEDEAASKGVIDRRVPFILKMANKNQNPATFAPPFNTILTHDLLLAILRGEVSTTKGAADWLNKHRSIGRSPYDDRNSRDAL